MDSFLNTDQSFSCLIFFTCTDLLLHVICIKLHKKVKKNNNNVTPALPHWSTSMRFCKSSVTGTHPLYISPSHSSVSVVSVDAEGGYDIFYDSIVLELLECVQLHRPS